jgi:hypothetical protein
MSSSSKSNLFRIVTAITVAAIFMLFCKWVFETGALTAISRFKQELNQAEYAAHAEDEIKHRCAASDQSSSTECIRKIVESTNEHKRAEGDLIAQSDMSLWAFWMVIISGAGSCVTAVGVYWVKETLSATEDMVREAQKTTAAAEKSLVEAQKANVMTTLFSVGAQNAANAQLRAYITVVNAEKSESSTAKQFVCAVQFKNCGQTPAYDVVIKRGYGIYDENIVSGDSYGERDVESTDPTVVGPAQVFQGKIRVELSLKTKREIASKSNRLILYGEIEYVDVFKEKRSTLFNLAVSEIGTKSESIYPVGKLNDCT